ncbi:putative tail fibers protein [Salmonella phage SE4]|uniref:tail fiber protein n=1 Tax=Salmonella phage SE4 TaxID=2575328 RepID=UPI0011D2CA82|nr:tail fiber protein [Salmonella phage SE4]QEG07763.1 putative tail fibers protein [Salmonella phage SE4]
MADVQTRPDNDIFASSAGTGELLPFGDLARGWGATLGYSDGIPPMEWFNFIGNRTDKGIHYILQQGVDVWVATETYPVGALVKVNANNMLYRCLVQNINMAPANNPTQWRPVLDLTAASAAAKQVGKASGNVIQVGSFGLGGNAELVTNASSITNDGLYQLTATGVGGPESGTACEILHMQIDANNATQWATPYNKRILYIRNKVNGTWNTWEGQYGPSNRPNASDLNINQDFIPMDGSDSIRGNMGTVGWVHIARTTSDLFRAANTAGVAVHEVSGNVAGGTAVTEYLTSVSVSANSNVITAARWGSVPMTHIQHLLVSGGATQINLAVSRAGGIADRRIAALSVDGANNRVTTLNSFTLCENGTRVYSPNNPQPVDLSSVVNSVRLGAEVTNARNGGESFVLRMPSGHAATGFDIYSKGGREDEFRNVFSRPIQILVNGSWFTVGQV